MSLFRLLRRLSLLLGRQRDVVRRLGGVALVVMGVHAAADVLDDLAGDALDVVDLVVDDGFAALLGTLSARGAIAPDVALRAVENFATTFDLAEKQWLALRIALVVELALDVVLLDLCWGARRPGGASRRDELRDSTRQLVQSLRSVDLERLTVPWVLGGFALGGAFVAATAAEQLAGGALAAVSPGPGVENNVAAWAAVVVGALLVARFVPDMVHGAVVRAHERGEHARQAVATRRQRHPPRWPAVVRVIDELRRVLRGAWLVLALGVALGGLLNLDVAPLLERVQAAP